MELGPKNHRQATAAPSWPAGHLPLHLAFRNCPTDRAKPGATLAARCSPSPSQHTHTVASAQTSERARGPSHGEELEVSAVVTGTAADSSAVPYLQLADGRGFCATTLPGQGPFFQLVRAHFRARADFETESAYGEYVRETLVPGMRIRMLNDMGPTKTGDQGEYLQTNGGSPPCQGRWDRTSSTYWVNWHMVEILGDAPVAAPVAAPAPVAALAPAPASAGSQSTCETCGVDYKICYGSYGWRLQGSWTATRTRAAPADASLESPNSRWCSSACEEGLPSAGGSATAAGAAPGALGPVYNAHWQQLQNIAHGGTLEC